MAKKSKKDSKTKKDKVEESFIERREHVRHDTNLKIRFRDRRNLKGEFINDISYGGVFVVSQDPMPVGSVVSVTLEAPNGKTLATEGEVVWVTGDPTEALSPPSDDADPKLPGMGIRFSQTPENISAIQSFINEIIES